MRNLPQKILLPQQEAQLQQHKLEQMLRLREQQQQELRERKVQMDYLAAADKVDKWADKAVAVDKVVKVVAAVAKVDKVDKVVAVDKVVKAVAAADKVDRVAE